MPRKRFFKRRIRKRQHFKSRRGLLRKRRRQHFKRRRGRYSNMLSKRYGNIITRLFYCPDQSMTIAGTSEAVNSITNVVSPSRTGLSLLIPTQILKCYAALYDEFRILTYGESIQVLQHGPAERVVESVVAYDADSKGRQANWDAIFRVPIKKYNVMHVGKRYYYSIRPRYSNLIFPNPKSKESIGFASTKSEWFDIRSYPGLDVNDNSFPDHSRNGRLMSVRGPGGTQIKFHLFLKIQFRRLMNGMVYRKKPKEEDMQDLESTCSEINEQLDFCNVFE